MELLCKSLPEPSTDGESAREVVIGKALDILTSIHTALVEDVDDHPTQTSHGSKDRSLEDAKRRRALHALLDLISLEGIYPTLSQGAGIPLRERVISVLPAGVIAKSTTLAANSSTQNELLLDRILTGVCGILFDVRPSIQPVIRGRILSDIVSGTANLAFHTVTLSKDGRSRHREAFRRVLNEYVSLRYTPCANLLAD